MIEDKLLKKISMTLEPAVRVGKNGLTEGIIKEIEKHLKKKKIVKVKILNSFIEGKDKKELAEELAEKTNSRLIHAVGFTVTLYKE